MSGLAKLPSHPQSSQIRQRHHQHQQSHWKADPLVGQRKVDRAVRRRVVDQNSEDGKEG